jgi:hypothetical protein
VIVCVEKGKKIQENKMPEFLKNRPKKIKETQNK